MTLPGNLNTITLTGTYLDSTGAPETGTISFVPPPELVDINTAIMYSKAVTATLDMSGSFSVTLICTDNPTLLPVGWSYTVTENISGTRSYSIYLPSSLGSSTDISGRVPLPTLTGGSPLTPTSAVAPGYAALAYNNTFTGTNTFSGPIIFSGSASAANALIPTGVKTANYTAVAGNFVPVDTTANAVAVQLPTAPADRTVIGVKIVVLGAGHNVTILCGSPDVFNKSGGSTTLTLSLLGQGALLQYSTTLGGWYVLSDDLPLAQTDARYIQSTTLATANGPAQLNGSGLLPVAQGGTGASSLAALLQSANNLSDLGSASTARTNLGLTSAATATLPLSIANGGTGQNAAGAGFNALSPVTTLGDLMYGSAANTVSRLAGSTSATKMYFTQTGNGTISAIPAWGTIQVADVPTLNQNTTGTAANITGIAAIANGGTGGTTVATAVANLLLGTTASTGSTTATTTLTSIFSGPTIAANSIAAGSVFEFCVTGVVTTTVGTQTFSVGLYWGGIGGVAIVNTGAIEPNSGGAVTGVPFTFRGTLIFTSTTQAVCDQQLYMNYFLQNASSGGLVTVATNASKQIVVGAQASASAASMTCQAGYVQRLQ